MKILILKPEFIKSARLADRQFLTDYNRPYVEVDMTWTEGKQYFLAPLHSIKGDLYAQGRAAIKWAIFLNVARDEQGNAVTKYVDFRKGFVCKDAREVSIKLARIDDRTYKRIATMSDVMAMAANDRMTNPRGLVVEHCVNAKELFNRAAALAERERAKDRSR